MCALYRHGACLDNQIDLEVTQTTYPLAKSVADFGHVMNNINSYTDITVMSFTCIFMNIYRTHANSGTLLQYLSTNQCTYFTINVFHLFWLLHVSAGRHPQGAGDQIP